MTHVIVGGTKGIGLAIAKRLARPGQRMVLAYHSDVDAARSAKAMVEAGGAEVELVCADIGTIAGCESVMRGIGKKPGAPLHIVHSAAMIYPTTLLDADLEKFTRAIHANGLSLLYLVQKALPLLDRGSSVVFISGAGARTAISTSYGAIGAGKALAEGLMRYLVPELAPRGVRINAVAPGLVHTTSVATMLGSQDAAAQLVDRAARANPSGRGIRDEDYTALVDYLLSPAAEYIQGQIVQVSGGAP